MKKRKLMQWTYFLDILGFGEEQKKIDTQEKSNEFIEFMKTNNEAIYEQIKMNKAFYKDKKINIYDYYDFKSVFISDSFVITIIPNETLFDEDNYYDLSTFMIVELTYTILIFIEHILTEKGLLVRGGISNKFTDINTESSLAVGEGLIESYNLESKYAEIPRILLSKEISNDKKIMSYFEKHSKKYGENFSIFCKDTNKDDFYYLDYLGYILGFLNISEEHRLSKQDMFENHYGINKEILLELQSLIKHQNTKNFNEKVELFFTNNNLYHQNKQKLIKMIKESEKIVLENKEDIYRIQEMKTLTINTLKKLKEVIQKNLVSHSENQKVLKKYIWLREYFNNTIGKFPNLDFIQEYKIK